MKTKKTKTVKVPVVTLTSYSVKAIIPTGPYANIQAEIVVNASSLDDAKGYVIPHINTLFEEFLNKSERRETSTVTVKTTAAPVVPVNTVTAKPSVLKDTYFRLKTSSTQSAVEPPGPEESVPFAKAKAAINSCVSSDALGLVTKQVEKSIKLNKAEKLDLYDLISKKTFS